MKAETIQLIADNRENIRIDTSKSENNGKWSAKLILKKNTQMPYDLVFTGLDGYPFDSEQEAINEMQKVIDFAVNFANKEADR